jgi:hypothetical protein
MSDQALKIAPRFLLKLREVIREMKDIDGELGHFASVVYEQEHLGDYILFVNTGPDDLQPAEEKYALTIRRLK